MITQMNYFDIIKINKISVKFEPFMENGYWIVSMGVDNNYKEVHDTSLERAIQFLINMK